MPSGWEYQGQLENARSKPCVDGEDYDLGAMWECPFLADLGKGSSKDSWILCVSPYPHHRKDRPTNPCIYWLGSFEDNDFKIDSAAGAPLQILDLIVVII